MQNNMQAPLPPTLEVEQLRTELSLKSYHFSPFFAQAVQCPPPSPPKWLLTAYNSQIGFFPEATLQFPLYLGWMNTFCLIAYSVQPSMGSGSMRQGAISNTWGKMTLVSFFSLRNKPFCLNLLRWRIIILGALYMFISLKACLCSLHEGQYHSLPAQSCSGSLMFSKHSFRSIGYPSCSFTLNFLVWSSKSLSLSRLKSSSPTLVNLMSSSQAFSSYLSKRSLSLVVSYSYSSPSYLYSNRQKERSNLRPCLSSTVKGFFFSIMAQQSSQDLPPKIFERFLLSLQPSLQRYLSTLLYIYSPVDVSLLKNRGNLNQRLSNQFTQYPFLLNRQVSSTLLLIAIYYSVSCTAKMFLLSFYDLYTISLIDSRPARQMPSFILTKYISIDFSSTLVISAILEVHSSTLGLKQGKFILFVLCSKLRKMKKHSKLLTTFWGMGKVTVMKGSKVIDYFLQSGQVTLDLYCPAIRSVMID